MLLAELFVLFGIKRAVEENIAVFVSALGQGGGNFRERRAIANIRWFGSFARARRHRISKTVIEFVCGHFCYEKVTQGVAKLKEN